MREGLYPEFFLIDGAKRNKDHRLLTYSSKVLEGRIPLVAVLIIQQYGSSKLLTEREWKKEKRTFYVSWKIKDKIIKSNLINYNVILTSLRKNLQFIPSVLNLPPIYEEFIDISTNYGLASHRVTTFNKPQINFVAWNRDGFLGKDFPIKPILAREGFCIESFLDIIIARIIFRRDHLVKTSNKFYSFEWFFDLRDLINDCISSIEITLNLVYNKAKYHPNPNWVFNEKKLGLKYGRRFRDKLKWVEQISGSPFNIEKYADSLYLLKDIRNHLNHFDPPSFCLTAEESPKLLNSVLDIGMIHIEMRRALKLNVSVNLINLVLQNPVIFSPENDYLIRVPFKDKVEGYSSCNWPNE